MARKKMTRKMTVDDLTGEDMIKYQPSFRDKDISITSQLAALDPPYSYERKQDGEVVVFSIRWAGRELFRLILNPESIFYGYHRVGNIYDEQEGARINYICSRIYNDMRFDILTRKMFGEPRSDQQLDANQQSQKRIETQPSKESKSRRFIGLRIDYLVIGITLGLGICVASLFLFPEWGLSIRALVILIPVAFAAATGFISNFRRAYE